MKDYSLSRAPTENNKESIFLRDQNRSLKTLIFCLIRYISWPQQKRTWLHIKPKKAGSSLEAFFFDSGCCISLSLPCPFDTNSAAKAQMKSRSNENRQNNEDHTLTKQSPYPAPLGHTQPSCCCLCWWPSHRSQAPCGWVLTACHPQGTQAVALCVCGAGEADSFKESDLYNNQSFRTSASK